MAYDAWIDALVKRLGPPIFTTGDEVRFNCWRQDCGTSGTPDTKYHMYVNPEKDKYFCQRCQRGGTLENLSKYLDVPSPEKSLSSWDRVIREFLFGRMTEQKEEFSIETIPWPDEYSPMLSGTQAYQYLLERGISNEQITFYQIGFGTGFLRNRIVFPDVSAEGDLLYWVARTYGEHYAKYRNADAPREYQIYNLGRVEASGCRDRLVICEGPISAIAAGYDAVATYGKYVTRHQISRLVQFGAKEYIIAGDGDAVPEAVSLATRLYRKGLNVKYVLMGPDEDPASIGGGEIRNRIREAKQWSDTTMMEVLL